MNKIGFIGCGAMGSALIRGMVQSGGVNPETVFIFDLNKERQESLAKELNVNSAENYKELVSSCNYIFISVKPQDSEGLLYSIKPDINENHIIISIAAGITIGYMESCLFPDSKIVRLMPNTPCLIGEGTIVVSTGDAVSDLEYEVVDEMLKPLGLTIRVPESLMDAATGLSGTGPAYVFLFIETMIDAGVAVGIRRDVASKMVIQNVIGSARLMQENTNHPAELRNTVTSPAGTTSAAMQVLEERGFRSCLVKAVIEASHRSEQLRRG